MGRLVYIGNEQGSLGEYVSSAGGASISASEHHGGAYSLKILSQPSGDVISYARVGFAASAAVRLTLWVKFASFPSSERVGFFWGRIVANPMSLRITSQGKIDLFDQGTPVNPLASGSKALSLDTWHRLDLYWAKGSAGACAYEFRIDGDLEYSGSNGTFGTGDLTGVYLGVYKDVAGGLESAEFYFDDECFRNDTFEPSGVLGIYRLLPNANGYDSKHWTGTPANGYQDVDDGDSPDGDGSYWYTTSTGGVRCCDLPSCDSAGIPANVEILSVLWHGMVRCLGGAPEARPIFRSGENNYGTAFAPSVAYAYQREIRDVDPATEAAWTRSGVDALQIGIGASQLGSEELRCTMFEAFVLIRENPVVEGSATASGRGTVQAAGAVTSAGSSHATGTGVSRLDATVVASASFVATGRGTVAASGAVSSSAMCFATGSGGAELIAAVIVAGLGAATGRGIVEIVAAVTISASAIATGRATASCDGELEEQTASATATGRGFAFCLLTAVYFDPLARHFGTRAVRAASAGVRSVSRVHHASRACVPDDERVCGPRRLS